jgi:hypothetical protein
MKRKSGLSGISSGTSSETLTGDFTIYDVPGAILEARAEAYKLLKYDDLVIQVGAKEIIKLLSRSIRAMGREDIGVLVENLTKNAAPTEDAA